VVVLIEETPMLNSILTIVASSEEYWNAEFHSHIVALMNRPQNWIHFGYCGIYYPILDIFTAGALHYSFVVSSTCWFSQTPFMVSHVWMQVLFDTCLQKKL
jgi:hypothetical protein